MIPMKFKQTNITLKDSNPEQIPVIQIPCTNVLINYNQLIIELNYAFFLRKFAATFKIFGTYRNKIRYGFYYTSRR
jgi:hypothetical protein